MKWEDFLKKHEEELKDFNGYEREECKNCFFKKINYIGTKLVAGRRVHFKEYGCMLDKCKLGR